MFTRLITVFVNRFGFYLFILYIAAVTKKQKILNKLKDCYWHRGSTSMGYQDFRDMDMSPTVEYQETYCDVIYARRVLQKEGYKVLLGTYGLYIYDADYH